ncbi:MAG: type II toxin-antitoxin system RatA family toxin [Fimbriimonas sp.]
MPVVETSVWINAPLAKVYAIAKDSTSYPEYMKDVQSVTLVESTGDRLVEDWVGIITQFALKVRWRQETIWHDDTFTSEFRQIKGDYDKLEGGWSFVEENGGTRFNQKLEYEYNVPTLAALINKVIYTIVVKNLENINEAFRIRAEA